jgi:hypothetical protein
MDIYVVSNVYDRGGSTIVGAGVERADAEALADRFARELTHGTWSDWLDISREMGHGMWERVTASDPRLSQEIVCVPLAGYIGDWPTITSIDETGSALSHGVPALVVRSEIAEIGRQFGAP